jgi:hypothetical protein
MIAIYIDYCESVKQEIDTNQRCKAEEGRQ